MYPWQACRGLLGGNRTGGRRPNKSPDRIQVASVHGAVCASKVGGMGACMALNPAGQHCPIKRQPPPTRGSELDLPSASSLDRGAGAWCGVARPEVKAQQGAHLAHRAAAQRAHKWLLFTPFARAPILGLQLASRLPNFVVLGKGGRKWYGPPVSIVSGAAVGWRCRYGGRRVSRNTIRRPLGTP